MSNYYILGVAVTTILIVTSMWVLMFRAEMKKMEQNDKNGASPTERKE
jgi:hypothetical protein